MSRQPQSREESADTPKEDQPAPPVEEQPADATTDEAEADPPKVEAEAADAGAAAPDALQALQAELEQAQAKLTEQADLYLRARADAENVRRRADNEVANSRKFAVESFAREMLNVRDSLDLASAVELSDGDDEIVERMREGLQLTLKQLDAVFEKFSIAEVEVAIGERLDPERHQAMSAVESDEVNSGEIVSVVQKGYTLHDRLLRAAMVMVAK